MTTFGMCLRVAGGAAILAAAIYIILSVPGFLTDRDSTVPDRAQRGEPPASANSTRHGGDQRDPRQRDVHARMTLPDSRKASGSRPRLAPALVPVTWSASAGTRVAKTANETGRRSHDARGTSDDDREGCRYAAGDMP